MARHRQQGKSLSAFTYFIFVNLSTYTYDFAKQLNQGLVIKYHQMMDWLFAPLTNSYLSGKNVNGQRGKESPADFQADRFVA